MRKIAALLAVALMAQSAFAASPLRIDRKGDRWAQTVLRKMSLDEKIGQMIVVWAHAQFMNNRSPEFLKLREEMRQYRVGGFGVTTPIEAGQLLRYPPLETVALTNELQRDSKYPLLFAADFERGPSMRLASTTGFPAAMAFGAAGDPELAREFGRISARETRALGIHWNWFPVADVNSNPANPIINTRSFGEDPALVSRMVTAFIEGARAEGMMTTAKHFPGHGDTDTDSHIGLAQVNASRERLDKLELVPFRAAIGAGVDTIMVGHVTVPAIEPDPMRPASISPKVIDGLLKKELGFKGIVVTDALDMGALMRVFKGTDEEISGEQAVEAVLAGNDLVIIPASLEGAFNGLRGAVKSGRIPVARIDQSVLKILRMKAALGLDRNRFVDPKLAEEQIAAPESLAFADRVAASAITLARDEKHLLPIEGKSALTVIVVFGENQRPSDGVRALLASARQKLPSARVFQVDPLNSGLLAEPVLDAARTASRVLVVAESAPSPHRVTQGREGGSAGLDLGPAQLLDAILSQSGEKTVVAAFGSPYVGVGMKGIRTYVCTFSTTATSALALVRALDGEAPIHGRLPVTIPGIAQFGAGEDRDARTAGQGR